MGQRQPWVTCVLTDLLLYYLERRHPNAPVDYAAMFRDAEGIDPPADPAAFLRDGNNWIPLGVLRELVEQAERISGRKDVAYLASREYFDHGRGELLTLFEIVFRVLNDVRSVVLSSHLLASVQTNYLRLQSFESAPPDRTLYMLAQFPEEVRPTITSMHFVRGLAEGFPRLFSPDADLRCIEEISQLRIADIVQEFPGYRVEARGDDLAVRREGSAEPSILARRLPLRSRVVPLADDGGAGSDDAIVPPLRSGGLRVLTGEEETDPGEIDRAPVAFRIKRPGAVGAGHLAYAFEEGQIYDAPYSRFRFAWQEPLEARPVLSADQLRREVSDLLFAYLSQVRRAQTRIVEGTIEQSRLRQENLQLRREVEREYRFAGIVGQSKPMQELFRLIRSLAETDVSVLIQGETGTGKELIARAIHYNSPRRGRRFVAVNCGALTEPLLQSELFGHERGAFTGADARRKGIFEAADGGTLFLDEIGEISPATQVKLLRVLQDGEFQRVGGTETIRVNVRVLSATNQDVERLVADGKFRQDLYYRLHVFPIRVPPLRDRAEDIPLLVSHFVESLGQRMRRTIRGLRPEAMSLLMAYRWPGNVRELENVIQRMLVVAAGDALTAQDLPPAIQGAGDPAMPAPGLRDVTRVSSAAVETQTIREALAEMGGNVTRAAKRLGVSRATLQNKMKAYGLRRPKP